MVGTLKPYHMLKKLFEFIALKGDLDGKAFGASTCAQIPGLLLAPTVSSRKRVTWRNFHYLSIHILANWSTNVYIWMKYYDPHVFA